MFKVFGIVLLVVALAVAIVPNYTDCESQGGMITLQNGKQISMKCHWTGRAEMALAIPLLGIGTMMTFSRRRKSQMNLSVLGILAGAAILAVPTSLIGTCATPTMICNTAMKPALLTMGSVVTGISLVSLIVSGKGKEQ